MPESTTPESHRILRRSISVLLALGTMAAGNIELRDPEGERLRVVQTASAVSIENCLLSSPVTVLCQAPDAVVSTSMSIKPPASVITTTTSRPSPPKTEPASQEASKGLQQATAEEVKYLGCISMKESSNQPDNYNSAGPYYGKYQFLRSTWDKFVSSIGMDNLVGADIRKVDEAIQDYVALQFLRHKRNGEWGPNRLCVRYLLNA